jgi:hypothetical protein
MSPRQLIIVLLAVVAALVLWLLWQVFSSGDAIDLTL